MTQAKDERVQLPADTVWEILTDVNGWSEWFPTANTIRSTTGGGLSSGAEFFINPDQGAMATRSVLTVIEVKPPERLVFRVENIGKVTKTLEALNREPTAYTHVYEIAPVLNDPSAADIQLTVDSEMSEGRRRMGGKFFKQDATWEMANSVAYLKGLVKYVGAYQGRTSGPGPVDPHDLLAQWQRFARLTAYPEKLRTVDGHAEIRETLNGFLTQPERSAGHVDFILRLMCIYPPWLALRYSTEFGRRQAMRMLDSVAAWRAEKQWLGETAQMNAAKLGASLQDSDQRAAWRQLSALLQKPDDLATDSHFDECVEVMLSFSRDADRYQDYVRLVCQAFVEWPDWAEAIAGNDQPETEPSTEPDEGAMSDLMKATKKATRSTLESAAQSYIRKRSGTDWWKSSARLIATMTAELESKVPEGDYSFSFEFLPPKIQGAAKGRPGFTTVVFDMVMVVEPEVGQQPPDRVAAKLDFDFGGEAHILKVRPEDKSDSIGQDTRSHRDSRRDSDTAGGRAGVNLPGASLGGNYRTTHMEGSVDTEGMRRNVEQMRVRSYGIGGVALWEFYTTDHKAATGGFPLVVEAIVSREVERVRITGTFDITGPPDARFDRVHEHVLPERKRPPNKEPSPEQH